MKSLLSAFRKLIEPSVEIFAVRPLSGGCISNAMQVTLSSDRLGHRSVFAKSNEPSFLDNFQCERDGLIALQETQTISIPQPIAIGIAETRSWLITQWVQTRSDSKRLFEDFGRQLANLHRASKSKEIGWPRDNYLGAARQPNTGQGNWVEFVAQNRIGFQLRWAIDAQRADAKLRRDGEAIIASLPELLSGRADESSLLHGDLWSGNYLFGSLEEGLSDAPVLIDPAVSMGCREAEFGMLRLFGSCPPEFYNAYEGTWPLAEGWQRRVQVYVLYHLLNHLNLFGNGYLSQCHHVASEILRGES